MKKVVNDVRLMTKVCDLYYNQDIGQQQISNMLNISRPTISRLLSAAREQGIVKIQVSDLESIKYWELERQLMELYGLKDVIIVDSAPTHEEIQEALGRVAGRYLEHRIKDGNVVGVSMGYTLHQVVSHVVRPEAKDVTFVPLIGGMGQLTTELNSNSLAERFSRIYNNGKFVPLYAPGRVSSAAIRRELIKDESIAAVLRLEEHMDVAIMGIGWPDESCTVNQTGCFKEHEIESLIERGAAGEICMQFFDINGDTTPYKNDNHVTGIEVQKLRKVPCSIGIVGGIERLNAIKGAIRGRYINVLMTDCECAAALVRDINAMN